MNNLRIGFLAARLDEPYQHAVWTGAQEEAEQLGATVVFFGGQRVGSPVGFEALDNIAFDLAARSEVAALAVMTNVIGTYLSKDELFSFLKRLEKVPLVSVGIDVPGIRGVHINNDGGMIAVADHLVRIHKRRRFLFLAGPQRHGESIAREREFIGHLGRLLGTEYTCVVEYCNFQEDEAWETTARYFFKDKPFDAVVAANDLMAMGALRALAEAGVKVGEEVSVTGFDDTEDSRFSIPPLTTVRQGAYELGRQAIRSLGRDLGLLDSKREPLEEARVSFIIRESCGCPAVAHDEPGRPSSQRGIETNEALAILAQDVNVALNRGKNPASLKLRAELSPLKDRAMLIIAEGIARYQASLRRSAERRATVLREIESSLVASFALTDILSEVARGTQALGISACWLALFESKGDTPEWARLLLASEGNKKRILAPYGIRFRTTELIPGGLPQRWKAYVCEPLRFGEERLGYLICTADSEDRRVFEALRDQVSSAIKGALLMAAERDRERRLEHEVRIRTLELYSSNERLREEVERRRSLERELLDISNDIMARIGRDIHDDLCQNIAGIALMAAALEGSLRRTDPGEEASAAQSAALIAETASKTAAQAKSMARGLYPAELEAKGLVRAVEDLVHAAQERSGIPIIFEVQPGFFIKDSEKALHLYRIIQEALNNSLVHAQASEIRVALRIDRENIQIEVADNGVGMPQGKSQGLGMGLGIMKYRSSVIGGELRINSRNPGTSVSCRIVR